MYTRPWRYIFVKKDPTRKTISKLVYGIDSEPMDTRGTKVTVKVK